ncbi:putative transcriptional regulator [Vibrio parahaemolyticus VP2007-007]|nr:putative transcriptional regulator [Vibrio parahaemolyticus VP2007-007]
MFGDKTLLLTTVFVFSSRLSAMNLKLLHLMTSESKAQEVADALQYSRFSTQPF